MIDPDDEIVKKAENEITEILLENLQITAKAVDVYKEYLFILTEAEKLQEFLAVSPRKREDYIAKIQVYLDTIHKIKTEAPYEIRMSMFLVQCHELNEKLIHECEKLILAIVKRMYDVNVDEAT
jgi:hypothetical protein